MDAYPDSAGKSGIAAFEIGEDFIRVRFKTGRVYRYSYKKPGKMAVEKMKRLARQGRGLATFISQEVREDFERIDGEG